MTTLRVLSLLLYVMIPWAGTVQAEPSVQRHPFRPSGVALAPAERQTVVTGFFLGGPVADLAVVRIDDEGRRLLRIYSFRSDSWVPALDARLRDGVLCVDVAGIGGQDRLVTYEPGRVTWFDTASSTEHLLVEVISTFDRRAATRHVDITHDLNHDGRDDLGRRTSVSGRPRPERFRRPEGDVAMTAEATPRGRGSS